MADIICRYRRPGTRPPLQRFLLVWLLAGSVGLLYLATLAPAVVWQDSAMFQVRIWQVDLRGELALSMSHPLYIVVGWAFAKVTPGDFAWRVSFFSAVCSAGAIGFLFAGLRRLTRSTWSALAATGLLAVSHTFWTHAVIAEVYGLYTLLLAVEMYLLIRYHRDVRHNPWWLIALCLVSGLNVSNHLLALLHLPAYGIYALLQVRARRIRATHLILMLLALVVGAGLYEAMIVAELAGGADLTDTVRSAFSDMRCPDRVLGRMPDLATLAKCVGYFLLNFPTPLLLLAPIGIYHALKDPRTRPVAAIWFATCALTFFFALRYRVPDQFVFFAPCYLFTAVFIGLAADRIIQARPLLVSLPGRIAVLVLVLLPVVVYELAPGAIRRVPFLTRIADTALRAKRAIPGRDIYTYFLRPRKNGDHSAGDFARAALKLAQPDGLIIAGQTTRNPIIYIQTIQGLYPGVYLASGDDLKAGREVTVDLSTVDRWLESGRRVFIVSPRRQAGLASWLEAQGRFSIISRRTLYEVQFTAKPAN